MPDQVLKINEAVCADDQEQGTEIESPEASQLPPERVEATTWDYQVQVYLKPVSCGSETMNSYLSTTYVFQFHTHTVQCGFSNLSFAFVF